MSTHGLTSSALECQACGYDLRAQAPDSNCPECGLSVAESRRLAPIPRRPAWRDSDPRWRRGILLGTWALVLMPLVAIVQTSEWASNLAVPTPFHVMGGLQLNGTFAFTSPMYEYVAFFSGVVLLFSKERNRRRGRFDWTRSAGVTTTYGVFLLGVAQLFFVPALVLLGIAALFLSMPVRFQPPETELLVKLSSGYLYYAPYPTRLVALSLPAFSSAAVMLACAPLYNALHSCRRKTLALLLPAPLFVAALIQTFDIARYGLGLTSIHTIETNYCPFYFNPQLLVGGFSDPSVHFIIEAAKWSACLIIAMRLSLAQIMAWRHAYISRRPNALLKS